MNQLAEAGLGLVIRVLVCDDDPMVRRALTFYLESSDDITLVDAVADVAAAQAILSTTDIDVLLLDLRMPVMDGRELAVWVAQQPHRARVLYLTSFDDENLGRDTIEGLAAGVLTKDIHPAALTQAIRSVHRGLTVMTSRPVCSLRNKVRKVADDDELSPRESAVLAELCAGRSNSAIARGLFVSESTVKNTIAVLMDRFEVDNRVSLALQVVDLGLV